MVDTAELFSFKRQRKLSLRFLAAFLLRIDIQRQALLHKPLPPLACFVSAYIHVVGEALNSVQE